MYLCPAVTLIALKLSFLIQFVLMGRVMYLLSSYSPLIQYVFDNVDGHDLQILYTQVNRDSSNRPHLTEYEYGVDAEKYFYPGSAIKLPGALLALEKFSS